MGDNRFLDSDSVPENWKKGGKGRPTGFRGSPRPFGPVKTAAWPGLPGKTQGKSRTSGDTKKLKQSPSEEGI